MTSLDVAFQTNFRAGNWDFISTTRLYVESYCVDWTHNEAFARRVGMVVHELLENASKYSCSPDAVVRCNMAVRGDRLRVEVTNQANRDELATLSAELAFVNEGDPLATYIYKMQNSLSTDKSQLGLARIRYEGEAELQARLSDDHVAMEASFELPALANDRVA